MSLLHLPHTASVGLLRVRAAGTFYLRRVFAQMMTGRNGFESGVEWAVLYSVCLKGEYCHGAIFSLCLEGI